MKKMIVGFLALSAMVSAQASTPYEALAQKYKQGAIPNLEKLANVALSGRCYSDNNQSEAQNAGYYIKKQKSFYEAFSYNEPRGEEDFFDTMTIKDIKDWNSQLTSVEIDASFFAVDRVGGFSSFKQSGKHLIEEQTSFVKVPGRLFNKWVVTGYCYYFNAKNN